MAERLGYALWYDSYLTPVVASVNTMTPPSFALALLLLSSSIQYGNASCSSRFRCVRSCDSICMHVCMFG